MVNYKPVQKQIDLGVYSTSIPQEPKILYLTLVSLSPISLLDISTNAVYVVPTGKTFQTFGFTWAHNATVNTMAIYEGDSEDAITSLKFSIKGRGVISEELIPMFATFTAGKYVTNDQVLNTSYNIFIYGIET